MADEPEEAAKPSKKQPRGKPVSLYPLSLEEAVDRLLKAKPEPAAAGKSRKS
jgi:hypothetical protein